MGVAEADWLIAVAAFLEVTMLGTFMSTYVTFIDEVRSRVYEISTSMISNVRHKYRHICDSLHSSSQFKGLRFQMHVMHSDREYSLHERPMAMVPDSKAKGGTEEETCGRA